MRDLEKDLEICNAATPGPWKWQEDKWHGGYSGLTDNNDIGVLYPLHANDGDDGAAWFDDWENDNDRIFIAAAREGWPHAIERAIKAEAELAKYKRALDLACSNLSAQIDSQYCPADVIDCDLDCDYCDYCDNCQGTDDSICWADFYLQQAEREAVKNEKSKP